MRAAVFLIGTILFSVWAQDKGYEYFHAGKSGATEGRPTSAFLLGGGENTTDEAYRWFAQKAGGGDAVTLRASGADAMNKVLLDAGGLNSALTFLFKDRSAAADPFVVERLRKASAVWIAGAIDGTTSGGGRELNWRRP